MFLVVWSIYLSDRLFDVHRCEDWDQATGRLRFGRRYRTLFLVCLGLALVGIGLLSLELERDVLQRAMIVSLGLMLHVLAFVVPIVPRRRLPGKEFGVGLFFALGAYACLGYEPGMLPLLAAICLLVSYNCLIIAARDADSDRTNDPGAASRWWRTMNRDLLWAGVAMTVSFGAATLVVQEASFFASVVAASLALTALHRISQKLTGDAVRALADFALFTPILAMGVGSHFTLASRFSAS